MIEEKWKSLLGLANRARKCISGEELVIKEVRKGNAELVILSKDASENTQKKLRDKCKYYSVPLRYTDNRYDLGRSIGKEHRVVVAVIDKGFANKIIQLLG